MSRRYGSTTIKVLWILCLVRQLTQIKVYFNVKTQEHRRFVGCLTVVIHIRKWRLIARVVMVTSWRLFVMQSTACHPLRLKRHQKAVSCLDWDKSISDTRRLSRTPGCTRQDGLTHGNPYTGKTASSHWDGLPDKMATSWHYATHFWTDFCIKFYWGLFLKVQLKIYENSFK